MKRRAWVSQLKRHIEQYGAENASWYVNWIDPDGKRRTRSCGVGSKGERAADQLADRIHSQLVTGTYESQQGASWKSFRERYEDRVVGVMGACSAEIARRSLNTFERLVKPRRVDRLTSADIDLFIARRKAESTSDQRAHNRQSGDRKAPRRKPDASGRKVAPATVNQALRYIKAALRTAAEWGELERVPRIRFLKEPKRLPTYVPPDHFSAIYSACDQARRPVDVPNVETVDWWRALLVTAYLTGWRVGQIMALKWADIDLDAGVAVTRWDENKGKRDMKVPLHPVIVDHLRRLANSGSSRAFPWPHEPNQLWVEFRRIQGKSVLADGSPLPKSGKGGKPYGFHDLRRAFATLNASSMNLFELQQLMQHRSLTTTQSYVNMAQQLNRAVSNLFVPDIHRPDSVAGGD